MLESVFGRLEVGEGDYVVVPASTTHRWVVPGGAGTALDVLIVESRGHVSPPKRYLSAGGQFLEHAPYCERDLRVTGRAAARIGRRRRRAGAHRRRAVASHPSRSSLRRRRLGRASVSLGAQHPRLRADRRAYPPAPPVHQTFEGPGFVVCSFVPRLYDFHPDAVKVPYHHANTDSDEVLFYSAGNFMSRAGSGIGVGSISFHPAGFVHGPQPGSYEASVDRGTHRRDGGDDRHVRGAAGHRHRPAHLRARVSVELGAVVPAHTKGSDVCAGTRRPRWCLRPRTVRMLRALALRRWRPARHPSGGRRRSPRAPSQVSHRP